MNLEFIKPQNLGSLLMKSSQSNFNLRSPGSYLVRSYLITTVRNHKWQFFPTFITTYINMSLRPFGYFLAHGVHFLQIFQPMIVQLDNADCRSVLLLVECYVKRQTFYCAVLHHCGEIKLSQLTYITYQNESELIYFLEDPKP